MLLHVLRNDALGGLEISILEVARCFSSHNICQHVVILSPLKSGISCLLYTSPSPRDGLLSRMPSSA